MPGKFHHRHVQKVKHWSCMLLRYQCVQQEMRFIECIAAGVSPVIVEHQVLSNEQSTGLCVCGEVEQKGRFIIAVQGRKLKNAITLITTIKSCDSIELKFARFQGTESMVRSGFWHCSRSWMTASRWRCQMKRKLWNACSFGVAASVLVKEYYTEALQLVWFLKDSRTDRYFSRVLLMPKLIECRHVNSSWRETHSID